MDLSLLLSLSLIGGRNWVCIDVYFFIFFYFFYFFDNRRGSLMGLE